MSYINTKITEIMRTVNTHVYANEEQFELIYIVCRNKKNAIPLEDNFEAAHQTYHLSLTTLLYVVA